MHPNTLLSFLVSAMAVTQVQSASNFSKSCSNVHLDNSGGGIVLVAECKRQGGMNGARLDLNQCYINKKGVVTFSKGGGFAASCGAATLRGTEATMYVTCGNGNGGSDQNTVHLDLHVGNSNGNLVC